jgi:hypothetical protein
MKITGFVERFGLVGFDVLYPRWRADPMLMSTRALLVWLSTRWCMAFVKAGGGPSRAHKWAGLANNFFDGVDDACTKLAGDLPSIDFEGVPMQAGPDGSIDVSGIGAQWPGVPHAWATIAAMPGGLVKAIPGDGRVPLREFYWFLFISCRFPATPLEPEHILLKLRSVTIEVSVWLAEVHCHYAILDEERRKTESQVQQLVVPAGGRVKNCAWTKYRLLKKVLDNFGSEQTSVSALDGRRGDAAVMRAVRNRYYRAMTREELQGAPAVSICVDGGCHGGLEVLVGSISSVWSNRAFYLRPQATR